MLFLTVLESHKCRFLKVLEIFFSVTFRVYMIVCVCAIDILRFVL